MKLLTSQVRVGKLPLMTLNEKKEPFMEFYNLTGEDISLLLEWKGFIEERAVSIVDAFYEDVTLFPHLVQIIDNHSTLEKLKETQVWYLKTLFSEEIDDKYIRGREKVGHVHARIGLSVNWFLGGFSIYIREIAKHLDGHADPSKITAVLAAASRRMFFDAGVITEQYIGSTYRENELYKVRMTEVAHELIQTVSHVTSIGDEFSQSSGQLAVSQESVHKEVTTLTEQSTEINKLSSFVGHVATQTNLLGINAAIEAARAGEHGRGFGVVANEVRRLADQTKTSSQSINSTVSELFQRIEDIRRQVESTSAIAQEQAASAEQLSSLISSLESIVQKLELHRQAN